MTFTYAANNSHIPSFLLGIVFLFSIAGCTSTASIANKPLVAPKGQDAYSVFARDGAQHYNDTSLILAFSGGGTRAAAFSYGVMQELRDTPIQNAHRNERALDHVDVISSVSGGSFTAAYYGLYGDRIFTDYEEAFLRQDVQGVLIHRLFNPIRWFSRVSRTDLATSFYEETVFGDATFADIQSRGGPLIMINATDLGNGVRFSFVQEYFDLICSDLSSFPVSRAVTASSAVPILFNPVALENHHLCGTTLPLWLTNAQSRDNPSPQFELLTEGLEKYAARQDNPYIQLVDGGITDNLGIRAIHDIIELSGGANGFYRRAQRKPPRHIAVIIVNAFVESQDSINKSLQPPRVRETLNAITDIQLQRYNAESLTLMQDEMAQWEAELNQSGHGVTHYVIELNFKDVQDQQLLARLNSIATSFQLQDEEIDILITTGRQLLRNNADFQRFLRNVNHQ